MYSVGIEGRRLLIYIEPEFGGEFVLLLLIHSCRSPFHRDFDMLDLLTYIIIYICEQDNKTFFFFCINVFIGLHTANATRCSPKYNDYITMSEKYTLKTRGTHKKVTRI